MRACSVCGLKEAPYYDDDGKCPLCTDDGRQNGSCANSIAGKLATMQRKGDLSRLQQAALEAVLEHDGSIRAAAADMGVNHGIISMALDGKETPAAYRALGVRKGTRHRIALEVDTPAEAAALRSLLARYGTRREVGAALASGTLRIVENESN